MKTQEVPLELREFYSGFRKLEYRHHYVSVFDDFLSAMMNYFTPPHHAGFDVSCFNKYTKEERLIIGSLIPLTIQIFSKNINDDQTWFDPFGDFYQLLASRGKQSALGQFFTPTPLINLIVETTFPEKTNDELIGKGLKINDPACGSGRFLIGFHARYPGNYVYGEDLDSMCCKMACINLMVHGCEGEIVNHNSLIPEHYIQGWKINKNIRHSGLPSITPITQEESFIYKMWTRDNSQQKEKNINPSMDKATMKSSAQLSIFS